MKHIKSFILMLLCVTLGLVACSDDDYIEIESLSAMGDEFYCNQKVKLWMCVRSSDLLSTDYQWECDGGALTQPQGLDEMTWQAPDKPGTYTVACKVSVGGKSERREHKLYVSSYFFEKFDADKAPTSFTYQSQTKNTMQQESDGNRYLQIYANSTSEAERYIRRTFGDPSLHTPFFTRLKIGYDKNMPTVKSIKVGSKTVENSLRYRWSFDYNVENGNDYMALLDFRWYPSRPTDGFPTHTAAGTENSPSVVVLSGTPSVVGEYNIYIMFQYKNVTTGKASNYYLRYYSDRISRFQNGTQETVSLGINENNQIQVYMSGEEIVTIDNLRVLREKYGWIGNYYVNQWNIFFTNNVGGVNPPYMYIDDGYASSELLK